jgi:hypothetical protein
MPLVSFYNGSNIFATAGSYFWNDVGGSQLVLLDFRDSGNDALSCNFMHGSKKESLGTKVGE